MKRASGVLMHISSLFGDYSVGSFSHCAEYFIDFLKDSGFSYWQVLPLCMTDEYNSPYKSYSLFGANPYFIDLETLYYKGLLTGDELDKARQTSPYLCEYNRLRDERIKLLSVAASRVIDREPVISYVNSIPELENAAKFLALKEINGGKPWQEFDITDPDVDTLFTWQFIQYEFFTQWKKIKNYANSRGIKIIGDLPIYVALDSADVWASPESYQLNSDNYPTAVAGVPPDYFSEDGQLWYNPLYNWDKIKRDGYKLWRDKLSFMLKLYDGVRIDHFRGLEAYWSVPADAKSAKEGKWVKGPGRELIDALKDVAGDKLIIAEDLGNITKEVEELLTYSNFPGMRVFQFAFLGDKETPHLPHNYVKNSVAYTGTHDNNTLLGYIWEQPREQREEMFDYCSATGEEWSFACEKILRVLLASVSDLVIFPIQDILGYGRDTRMNTPGVADKNWSYRITKGQLDGIDRKKFYCLNKLYSRI